MIFSRSLVGTLFATVILFGCRTPDADSLLNQQPAAAAAVSAAGLAHEKITDRAHFDQIAKDASGLIKGGKAVKFFIDNRNPATPKVYFINGNFTENGKIPDAAKFHYMFAQRHLNVPEDGETFNKLTYFVENKRYLAGTLNTYRIPTEPKEIFGIQFYPQDVIKGKKALDATMLVKKAINVPDVKFAFVATGSQQTVGDVITELENQDVIGLTIEKILGTIKYIPMHLGEAWGYLRIFPQSQDELTATDIPVFDELPLDLTVIAGTITKAYQDSNSHVNLKSKERNTPNAVMRDASPTHALLALHNNKPVHMTVTAEGIKFEPTTAAIIADKLKQKLNKPWRSITWERTDKILAYDKLCTARASDCIGQGARYGSKGANLGFLQHKTVLGLASQPGTLSNKLGYDLVPKGVAVPLKFYEDLVNFPVNKNLKLKLDELIAKERAGTLSAAARNILIKEVQGLFYLAKFPPANLAAIKAALASTLPGLKKMKVRSSANAEDIAGFDGAGLHDSFSAKAGEADNADQSCIREFDPGDPDPTGKMKPKSVQCGIKAVYGSLWNKRAIEERSFARIDHRTVSMGISLLPAYDTVSEIAGNSVVVTRVINTSDVYGYTLSVQKENNLVTNPDPGTWSEVSIAAFVNPAEIPTFTVTRFAKPKSDVDQLTEPVLKNADMQTLVRIAKQVETAWCRNKKSYYPGSPNSCVNVTFDIDKPASLDLELKYLANGQFVCKQVREFAGK